MPQKSGVHFMEFRISEVRDSFFLQLTFGIELKTLFFPEKRLDIVCAQGYIMGGNACLQAF